MASERKAKLTRTDATRPYLDVIDELAQRFHPYPQRLVEAFHSIKRELFIPEALQESFRKRVYNDEGYAGLLTQPSVIFDMVAYLFLKGKEKVFEGGTGTGYQTAILACLASHVYTVERDFDLLKAAKKRLAQLDITNVTFIHGDAAEGLPQYAPFDRMLFGAAIHGEIDQPLIDQMAARSRLLAPTGTYNRERERVVGDLLQCDKNGGQITQKINPIFNGTLFFMPLVSARGIGWTLLKDEYVASDQVSR